MEAEIGQAPAAASNLGGAGDASRRIGIRHRREGDRL
jgi:hypothetical protein